MTGEFAEFAKEYVLFCHVTTGIENRKYENLLEVKGGRGFPYLVLMDGEGAVIGKHAGPRSVEGFAKTGAKAKAFLALKAKADRGGAAAKIDLVLAQAEMGHLGIEEARAKLKDLGKLSPEQEARLGGFEADAEVRAAVKAIDSREAEQAASKKFYDRHKAGKAPPAGDEEVQAYWVLLMMHAETAKDAAAFEEALKALKARFGEVAEAQDFFRSQEDKLKTLKEAPAKPKDKGTQEGEGKKPGKE